MSWFVFFKQKTAYDMRISDWSSDVCSSDLKQPDQLVATLRRHPKLFEVYSSCDDEVENAGHRSGEDLPEPDKDALTAFLATLWKAAMDRIDTIRPGLPRRQACIAAACLRTPLALPACTRPPPIPFHEYGNRKST